MPPSLLILSAGVTVASEALGEGSFGEVRRAEHGGRTVVVKFAKARRGDSLDVQGRAKVNIFCFTFNCVLTTVLPQQFLRECIVIQGLSHNHIVPVLAIAHGIEPRPGVLGVVLPLMKSSAIAYLKMLFPGDDHKTNPEFEIRVVAIVSALGFQSPCYILLSLRSLCSAPPSRSGAELPSFTRRSPRRSARRKYSHRWRRQCTLGRLRV